MVSRHIGKSKELALGKGKPFHTPRTLKKIAKKYFGCLFILFMRMLLKYMIKKREICPSPIKERGHGEIIFLILKSCGYLSVSVVLMMIDF
jgi:hypothetical protein